MRTLKCAFCGNGFPYRSDYGKPRKYCSRKCYFDDKARKYEDKTDHRRLRWCSSCRKYLPVESFYGKPSVCKSCTASKSRSGQRERKKQLISYLGGKCSRCGWSGHPAPFQFHHRDLGLKTATWGQMRGRTWKIVRAWADAEKLELLCANCHAMEHYSE